MLRSTDESLARALTRKAAQLTLVGALAATPLAFTAGTAFADTDWDALAECESSGDWSTDTGNGFSGGLQFTPSTWKAFGGEGQPEDASRSEQIAVAERVKAEQGMNAWPTCSKKTGQTDDSPNTEGESGSSSSSSDEGDSDGVEEAATETVQSSGPSAVAAAGAYTVAAGDTLSSIASANGTSWQALAERNGITDPDVLSVGQQLVMG